MNIIKQAGKRSRRSGIWLLALLWFTITAGIGLMGPAMAMWSHSLFIEEDVNLGHIELVFSDYENQSGEWELNIIDGAEHEDGCLKADSVDQQAAAFIEPAEWTFGYQMTNKGTVPVVLDGLQPECFDLAGGGGMTIDPNHSGLLDPELDPGESTTGTLRIECRGPVDPGSYRLDFYLPYSQWNLPEAQGWNDRLHIEVNLNVI